MSNILTQEQVDLIHGTMGAEKRVEKAIQGVKNTREELFGSLKATGVTPVALRAAKAEIRAAVIAGYSPAVQSALADKNIKAEKVLGRLTKKKWQDNANTVTARLIDAFDHWCKPPATESGEGTVGAPKGAAAGKERPSSWITTAKAAFGINKRFGGLVSPTSDEVLACQLSVQIMDLCRKNDTAAAKLLNQLESPGKERVTAKA